MSARVPIALVVVAATLLGGCATPSLPPEGDSDSDIDPTPVFSWKTLYYNGTVGPTACAGWYCLTEFPLDEFTIDQTGLVVRHVRLALEWDPPLALCDKMRLQLYHELHFATYGFGSELVNVQGIAPLEAARDELAVPLNDTSRLLIVLGPKDSFIDAHASIIVWASLEIPYRLRVEIETRPLLPEDAGLLDEFALESQPTPPESAPNSTLC